MGFKRGNIRTEKDSVRANFIEGFYTNDKNSIGILIATYYASDEIAAATGMGSSRSSAYWYLGVDSAIAIAAHLGIAFDGINDVDYEKKGVPVSALYGFEVAGIEITEANAPTVQQAYVTDLTTKIYDGIIQDLVFSTKGILVIIDGDDQYFVAKNDSVVLTDKLHEGKPEVLLAETCLKISRKAKPVNIAWCELELVEEFLMDEYGCEATYMREWAEAKGIDCSPIAVVTPVTPPADIVLPTE